MKWTSPIKWLVFDTKIQSFGLRLPWRRENSIVTQNLKATELHKVTLWAKKKKKKKKKKKIVTPMRFQQPK